MLGYRSGAPKRWKNRKVQGTKMARETIKLELDTSVLTWLKEQAQQIELEYAHTVPDGGEIRVTPQIIIEGFVNAEYYEATGAQVDGVGV